MLTRAARSLSRAASAASAVAAPVGTRSISFDLTDDQKAYQNLARDFAAKEIIPAAAELDRTMEYPNELFNKVSPNRLNSGRFPTSSSQSSGSSAPHGSLCTNCVPIACQGALAGLLRALQAKTASGESIVGQRFKNLLAAAMATSAPRTAISTQL